MKMNNFKLHAATQMKLINPTLSERNQTQRVYTVGFLWARIQEWAKQI